MQSQISLLEEERILDKDMKNELRKLQEDVKKLENEKSTVQSRLEKQNSHLKLELEGFQTNHERIVSEFERKHKEELARISHQCEMTKKDMVKRGVESVRERFLKEKGDLQRQYDENLRRLSGEWEEKIKKDRECLKNDSEKLHLELKNLKKEKCLLEEEAKKLAVRCEEQDRSIAESVTLERKY
ncbi:predicted protein [Nematostella vectensis]|uniref:Uncharacterized protein n=1 Tax=Nematostella vectensis TaxID=45351 RepID=A8DV23_NEMVE|nr:predicted protein [Nematostella vectensis]|eukprot:XP_001618659.1 hypothetical protein NEMVEDRAFT_v1g224928 [Nematostella vectensis]